MKTFYVCWVDDVPGFVSSLDGRLELLQNQHSVSFVIDEHNNTSNFDSIARAVTDDIFFFIDYNLRGANGNTLDGHELIRMIRSHNSDCPIVFYSSNATQTELRNLVADQPNVRCVLRESISEILSDIADGTFSTRNL